VPTADLVTMQEKTERRMENVRKELLHKPMSLHEFRKRYRKPLRNINVEMKENLSRLDRLAVWITTHVGTMGFFLIILMWTVSWLGWNWLAPPLCNLTHRWGSSSGCSYRT
jgi:hypothetical protein